MNQIQNKMPFTIKKEAEKLTIYLYDDIKPDEVDRWTGEKIPSETSAKTISQLLEENPNVAEIELHINSNGGDVEEAVAIYSLLKRHKAKTTAYIDGFAASAASVIPMACDKIIMSTVSLMFIHRAWMWACGNPEQLRKAAHDLEVIDAQSNKAYKEKAGEKISQAELDELLDGETWLSAEECLKIGLCDEIENKVEEKKTIAQQMFNNFQQKNFEKMQKEQKSIIQKMGDSIRLNKKENKEI
ncbi:MAG: Clp protease ClpP [Ruminococcus sp.]|nr:Clp protease ClpP [Candidatus Copronaster equi]